MNRIYHFESSSTKLAIFFSTLLIFVLFLLSIEIYAINHGEIVKPIFTQAILALVMFICVSLLLVSFYVTKRINAITTTADRIITTRDLTQRIPIDNKWDDLSKLGEALNMMLDEIEQLVASVRQVSDNIAHDLRTPLTRLRNHIETMRNDTANAPLTRAEQQEEFNTLIGECDGLLTTFNALLRIANIESGRRHANFHTLDLVPVLHDVIELYEPVAHEKNILLQFDATATHVIGDKDLLFQAMANLLDNAIKHTPEGGTISLRVVPEKVGGTITIQDTGPGIPDAHKPHVFRRFYRIAACRNMPGSGLGLSLVSAIITLHQGSISLSDNKPYGLIVTITL